MKRDMDFIRNLLLDIEANENINGKFTLTERDFGVGEEDLTKVQYHLRLLFDADYLKGIDGSTVLEAERSARDRGTYVGENIKSDIYLPDDEATRKAATDMRTAPMILVERMTFQGHEFLDTVRDDVVWQKTQEQLKKVGNFGIEGVKALAKGFLKQQVKKQTGIELDF